MSLPKIDKPWLLAELSKASLILAVASGLPYYFGEAADVLGPTSKKWITISAVCLSALAKSVQWAIQLVSAFTGAPVPLPPAPLAGSAAAIVAATPAAPENPLMKNNPVQGPMK